MRARRAAWGSASASSPRRSGRARASRWTSSASAWPTAPTCGCTRPARPCWRSPARPRARATRPRSPRSSPRNWACPRTTSRSCTATPTGRRSAWAPTAPGRRRSPARRPSVVARKVRERARIVAAAMLEVSADDLEWTGGRWQVRGDPDQGQTHRRDRDGGALLARAARGRARGTWTRIPSTTRRT